MLRAALVHFTHHGFAGTNLRSMAATAGVDAALISRQFGSKLNLWRAAVDLVSERMVAAQAEIMASQIAGTPISDRLRLALDGFVRFSCELPELSRFFTEEIKQAGERRDYVLDKIWRVHRDAMLPLLKEAKVGGLVPADIDPEFLLVMLIGAVAMPLMMQPVVALEIAGSNEDRASHLSRNVAALFLR
jgi:TetR/AcrR family transcriptional regulator